MINQIGQVWKINGIKHCLLSIITSQVGIVDGEPVLVKWFYALTEDGHVVRVYPEYLEEPESEFLFTHDDFMACVEQMMVR